METDKRLEILCEKFTDLKEAEKDYILGISQALAFSASVKNGDALKNSIFLSSPETNKTENNRNIRFF